MLRMLRCSLDLMLTERLVVARLKPVSVSIVSLLDVMLTVSLVLFFYLQFVRAWNPLLISSHADHFSCDFVLLDCTCLESIIDFISC